MRILVCRHGYPDYENDSLTERGVMEAELLSQRLAPLKPTDIYCSILGRAKLTAKPTVEKTGVEPVICDWLQEYPISANVFPEKDGDMSWLCPWAIGHEEWFDDEKSISPTKWLECDRCIGKKFPEHQQNIITHLDGIFATKGLVREGSFYRKTPEYEAHKDDVILIFCHYGAAMGILAALLPLSAVTLWNGFNIDPTGVTEFMPDKVDAERFIMRCIRLNDVSHFYGSGNEYTGAPREGWYLPREERDAPKV